MKAEACAGVRRLGFGVLGEFGEELEFDGAEQDLRGPEAETYLQNVIGAWFVHDGAILLNFFEAEGSIVDGKASRSYRNGKKHDRWNVIRAVPKVEISSAPFFRRRFRCGRKG